MDGAVHAGALTRNELLVPLSGPDGFFVAVMVNVPVLEMVTLWEARTPFVNPAVAPLPADNVPVELIITLFDPPLKLVTVLLNESTALTLMLKGAPAVCVGMMPPLVFVTSNALSAPGLTV